MSARPQQRSRSTFGRTVLATSWVLAGVAAGSTGAAAQEAIGVPFVGRNHLSFYTTELSRDGIADRNTTIFGGAYGRRFGERTGSAEVSMILRVGARPLEGPEAGVLDVGATLAATHAVAGLEALSLTASAGAGAVLWGHGPDDDGTPGTGRLSGRVPLGLGAAYDLRLGGATVSPFSTLKMLYSREYDFIDDERTLLDRGWRLGHMTGVNVRFKEVVLSVAELSRERGLPGDRRVVFSAGMSW